MTHVPRSRSGRFHLAGCLAVVLAAGPLTGAGRAAAQEVVATPNPDADRLADVVRRLGSAPRDLSALIEAGDLSFALGDATAAAALYKRAEAIDPNNGRVEAGIARILVNGERPGEALRYFEQAQRHGAPMPQYADDRGLAYDLIGEQERAQQDYRLALAQGGREAAKEDEIRRRLALSLGISGRQEEALAQIEPLLRRQDRGAWRARAFILAMNGDVSGANKIATSMMPRGMAGGLAAFFQRLPTLSPVDRAFAVHFGEVAPTPARLADARMVPPLTPLAGTPARTQLASVTPTVQPLPTAQKKLSRSEQRRRDRAEAQLAAANTRAPVPAQTPTPAPVVAAATPRSVPTPTPAPQMARTPIATPQPESQQPARTAASAPVAVAQTQPLPTHPVTPAPQLAAATTTPPQPAVTHRAPPLRVSPPRISEDSILARIVAGISVPAAELGVAPMPGAQRVPVVAPPAPAAATLDEAAQTAERNAAADEQKRPKLAAAKRLSQKAVAAAEEPEEKPAAKPPGRAARAKELAAEKGRKQVAADDNAEKPAAKPLDRKARARELAAEKARKEAAAKEAAEKKAARAEPERIWVQVASGANEGDLPKAWKNVQGKADALAGKRAYSVSNRATNRLVTGPYKTEAEARAMVNTLKKQGLSAFTFTSEAGQKMTKLGGK
ncbi:tetratricopeptide (TPR) repeat protein [Sphingomonas endophytica]|uniref:Tetratricopeptide (TPR) repeat protein n=1 Tax=Sphingomonas endophytica TaxID=869719 RepID=A0ABR6N9H3_9SPHN|nr:SPOR domain-containing protein [Sphingomonas endophytica]MBB5727179.1 tetratricopeptide (TPR) repeat protein [Sphingomonas endophytica]